jgi:hypothetical protein
MAGTGNGLPQLGVLWCVMLVSANSEERVGSVMWDLVLELCGQRNYKKWYCRLIHDLTIERARPDAQIADLAPGFWVDLVFAERRQAIQQAEQAVWTQVANAMVDAFPPGRTAALQPDDVLDAIRDIVCDRDRALKKAQVLTGIIEESANNIEKLASLLRNAVDVSSGRTSEDNKE